MGGCKYFGIDGICGWVGQGVILVDFVLCLGNVLGCVLVVQCGQDGCWLIVVIGKDICIFGYMFEVVLEVGLVVVGVDVQLLGLMLILVVVFLICMLGVDVGIVISVLYNLYYDNGIKFFFVQGEKFDDVIEFVFEVVLDVLFIIVELEKLGKVLCGCEVVGCYIEFCKVSVLCVFDLCGVCLVLDCVYGVIYQIVLLLFCELGVEVIGIGVEFNGVNINVGVGFIYIDNFVVKVCEICVDFGIVFDGDGDCVLMVDDQGNLVDGDDLLYILV